MHIAFGGSLIENERQRTYAFGDQPHRAIDDGVARIAFARERGVIAGRPARPPAALERNETGRA
jgi:hypothetical protein